MIISVSELRNYITTDLSDEVLQYKLDALEIMIRKYTNNNFQYRTVRYKCDIDGGNIIAIDQLFQHLEVDDTIQISESLYNNGVYTIKSIEGGTITVRRAVNDEEEVLLTKVVYPTDVQIGVVNLMNWDINNRDKVGIKSESISRHSVTYYDMDVNSLLGYPSSLLGFLESYRKARF